MIRGSWNSPMLLSNYINVALVASTAGLARSMCQFYSEDGPMEDDDNGLCSMCMWCSLECVVAVCDSEPVVAWLGHPAIVVGLWCEVWACNHDYLHSFINRMGVATFIF